MKTAGVMLLALCGWPASGACALGEDRPALSDSNKERLVIDDMEDVSDWTTGSPVETTLSASEQHVKQGKHSLKFANVIDYTKGEKKYPVGWPRTAKNLKKCGLTDWTGYDFIEFWVYCDTSRDELPSNALSLGFRHTPPGPNKHFRLKGMKKDAWVKVTIPLSDIGGKKDIESMQFNLSESQYRHGDRVDFYIDDIVLTRYVRPVIVAFEPRGTVVYGNTPVLGASYVAMGRKELDSAKVCLQLVKDGAEIASSEDRLRVPSGDVALDLKGKTLAPGYYELTLLFRGKDGALLDRCSKKIRAIKGPFQE